MRSLFGIWGKPRLLVLASYTAALYAAVVIPFKFGLPLIPGATEVRPGIAVLLLCSFLFGPAAAWGGAFGNLIGDFFGGTLGPGSLFGFPANFLYAYVPYKMWELSGGGPIARARGFGWWARFFIVCWVSAAVCAAVIAWGIELVFHVPVMLLGGIIFSNNLILPLLLCPILIRVIAPRLEQWGLTYERIVPDRPAAGVLAAPGMLLLIAAGLTAGVVMIVGFAAMFLPNMGLYNVADFPRLQALFDLFTSPVSDRQGAYTRAMVIVSVLVALFVIGSLLLGHEKRASAEEAEAEGKEGADVTGGATALDGVSFSYGSSDRPALSDVSFEVKPGDFTVIMGRTGAGKTSLLRCLTGAIPHFYNGKFEGRATLFGRNLALCGPSDNADLAGTVFQDFESQLFSTNAELETAFGAENLGMPREKLIRSVKSSLQTVGLTGFEGRNPATLSGGEKQRLAIASILAMNPPLVLLDEPSTDLDPLGKGEIFDVLARLGDGARSVVLVEHEIEAAAKADRVLLMKDGRISHQGPPKEVFRNPDLLMQYGIRPLDGVRLLKSLGEADPPLEIDGTIERLKASGKAPDNDKYLKLKDKDNAMAAAYGDVLYELTGLHHSYGADGVALKGVDLTIRKGEFLAILGRNGSGKTTLAKHLNGLLKPTGGQALFKGSPVTSRPLSETAREVGFVFQDPDHQVFSATVEEELAFAPRNFGLPPDEIDRRVKAALEVTSLGGYEDRDPFHLTKGERQRVAVAGVLAGEPEVLILDEPTTGLDRDEQVRVMELLKRLNEEGHTVIIITHTVWVAAEYAHRTVLLEGGRAIADGTTREVFGMDDKLEAARVRHPDVTRIGKAFGKVFLSVEEFIECL